LISKTSDFCAPHYETKNVTHIQECVNADAAACVGECKWHKAPVVADNQQFMVGSDVFASNFCHPPVTAAWNMTAPACYVSQDAQSCELMNCVWSTGKEFKPTGSGYCLPEVLTATIPDFETCTRATTSTTCVTPCKWHDAFNVAPSTKDNVCTHKEYANKDEAIVQKCQGLVPAQTCQSDGCVWNLPVAVAPSTAVDMCTHLPVDVQNTDKISLCRGV